MPRSKSVLKRQRQNRKRRLRNRSIRSHLRTLERRVLKADDPEQAAVRYREFQKRLDQAAAKGALHPNTADRKKARAAKALRSHTEA